jgi:Amt family ammonium transporter
MGAVGWYLLGYGFAYGKDESDGFIGEENFAGSELDGDDEEATYYLAWVFQFTFCATTATIVSGSLAERTYLETYLAYSMFMCSFVYPVIAHWGWHIDGWLKDEDYIDFAGSGIVHMVGGASGMIGAFLLGPRYDIFGTYSDSMNEKTDLIDIIKDDNKLTQIARAVFNEIDKDHNGSIEKAEL